MIAKLKLINFRRMKIVLSSFFVITKQFINFRSIPIIIVSFNQLEYLKQLIDFLIKHNYNNIIIIDNNSSYPPLLDYFTTIEKRVTIHRLTENYGHLVFWKKEELFQKYAKGFYVVTDPDVVPIDECPADFLKYFKKILKQNRSITKVGFSLKIDNLPITNLNRDKVNQWESQFWKRQLHDGNYDAAIDTTFAIYRPLYRFKNSSFFKSIRTNLPYQSIHGGWYLDNKNLTEEQKFYFATTNQSSSWRLDVNGNTLSDLYN